MTRDVTARRARPVTLLLACVCCATPAATADPARPAFAVSSFDLGAVDQLRAKDADLANELNAQEWCTARPQPKAKEWNEIPAGVDPNEWVGVVTVGFGKRAEAYAFQFNGPQGAARLVAHVPHRKVLVRGSEQWTSPFVKLLNTLRVAHTEPRAALPPLLQLEVVETVAKKPTAGPDAALTLSPEKVLPPLRAILTAAACEAGWAPTPRPAPTRARVEVRVLDQACSFRVTFTGDGRETVVVRDRVPWEEFHDQLAAVFRQGAPGNKVIDFARPATGPVELLGVEKDRIVCVADDELTALDAATGAEAWRLRVPQAKGAAAKRVEGYASRRDAGGTLRVFRWTTAIAEVAPADGKLTPLAPVAAASSSSFDVGANGEVVVIQGSRLTYFTRGKQAWSVTETHPITAGPRLEADRVLVGTEHGDLIAFARTDGRELWRSSPGKRLFGSIATAGPLRLVFCGDDESLVAVDPAAGAAKWRFAAGDTLVQPPFEHDGSVVVVTKQNRVVRLNPTTGTVTAEVRRPTWVVVVHPLEVGGQSRLAVGDISGNLSLLGPDLKPTWEAPLAARFTGRAATAKLPAHWKGVPRPAKGGPDELIEDIAADAAGTRPFVLATDANGFLYKLSAEGIK